MDEPTFMLKEIREIPEAVSTLLERQGEALRAAGARLRERDPALLATVARGSSDHAAAYLKYATELAAGIPVASLGPSIASIFGRSRLGTRAWNRSTRLSVTGSSLGINWSIGSRIRLVTMSHQSASSCWTTTSRCGPATRWSAPGA